MSRITDQECAAGDDAISCVYWVDGGDIEYDGTALIPVNCIIEPDALLKAAVVFLKEGNNG